MGNANDQDEISTERIRAIVRGVVQGVNFRSYTVREARRLGLVGWVRNRRDGTVETVAEGSREQLEAFTDFLHVGSPAARVTEVEVAWTEASRDMDTFVVRY